MTRKNKRNKKKNVRLKYDDIEDGQIISEDSELDTDVQQTATHPAAINKDSTDSAVTQNTSNFAVITKHGSKGSSEQDENTAETTTDDRDIKQTATHPAAINKDSTASAVTQNTSTFAIITKHGSKGSSEQDQHTVETTTDAAAINTDAIGSEKIKPPRRIEQVATIREHPPITTEDIRKESTDKRTELFVGNIDTNTTGEDIIQLLRLNTVAYLRDNKKVQVYFNSKSKFKGYAIVEIFHLYALEILKLDGLEYKSRKLAIQIAKNPPKFDKSIPTYDRRGMQRGKGQQGNSSTSSKNKSIAVRPAPMTSSRQEESHTELGIWDQCMEAVGGKEKRKQNDKSMAQELQEKYKRLEFRAEETETAALFRT